MKVLDRSIPGCWPPALPDLAATRTWLLAWLLLALPLALMLATATAVSQAAPQPAPPDPCQMAPNLPYCP